MRDRGYLWFALWIAATVALFAFVIGGQVRFAHAGTAMNLQQNKFLVLTIQDTNGDHVGSEVPTVAVRRNSDGQYFDWNDSTFKASGWTTKNKTLTEDATNGVYHDTFNPPASETGDETYTAVYDNANTNGYGFHLTDSWTAIAYANNVSDQVWDEAIADHLTTGTTGKKLNDSAAGGDPWGTNLSTGGYTGNQAGAVLRRIRR